MEWIKLNKQLPPLNSLVWVIMVDGYFSHLNLEQVDLNDSIREELTCIGLRTTDDRWNLISVADILRTVLGSNGDKKLIYETTRNVYGKIEQSSLRFSRGLPKNIINYWAIIPELNQQLNNRIVLLEKYNNKYHEEMTISFFKKYYDFIWYNTERLTLKIKEEYIPNQIGLTIGWNGISLDIIHED